MGKEAPAFQVTVIVQISSWWNVQLIFSHN